MTKVKVYFSFSTQFSLLFTIPSKKSTLELANLLFLRIFHFICSKDRQQWTKCQSIFTVKTCHRPLFTDFSRPLFNVLPIYDAFSLQVFVLSRHRMALISVGWWNVMQDNSYFRISYDLFCTFYWVSSNLLTFLQSNQSKICSFSCSILQK